MSGEDTAGWKRLGGGGGGGHVDLWIVEVSSGAVIAYALRVESCV
jgi:hypothetical protein